MARERVLNPLHVAGKGCRVEPKPRHVARLLRRLVYRRAGVGEAGAQPGAELVRHPRVVAKRQRRNRRVAHPVARAQTHRKHVELALFQHVAGEPSAAASRAGARVGIPAEYLQAAVDVTQRRGGALVAVLRAHVLLRRAHKLGDEVNDAGDARAHSVVGPRAGVLILGALAGAHLAPLAARIRLGRAVRAVAKLKYMKRAHLCRPALRKHGLHLAQHIRLFGARVERAEIEQDAQHALWKRVDSVHKVAHADRAVFL